MFPQFALVVLLALTGLAGQSSAEPAPASLSWSLAAEVAAADDSGDADGADDIVHEEIAIEVPPAAAVALADVPADSAPTPQADPEEVVADRLVAPGRVESEVVDAADFQTIGVTWPADADVNSLDGQVRTRASGEWSAWVDLKTGDDAPDAGTTDSAHAVRGGTDPVSIGDVDAVQLAFAATDAGSPDGLTLALIGSEQQIAPDAVVGAAPAGSTGGSGSAVVRTASLSTGVAQATSAPRVISRAEWGAPAQVCTPDVAAKLVGAVVHHTAGSNSYSTVAQAMQQIRNDAAYHISDRGWCDLGYNFVVDKWGNIYEGRAGSLTRAVIGVHAGGFNTGTVGVSMLGTYGASPSVATQQAVGAIIGWRLGAYGVDPRGSMSYYTGAGENGRFKNQTVTLPRVFGHRDVSYTACPGDGGYAALGNIRTAAASGSDVALANALPIGQLETVTPASNSVRVKGWALDPDTSSPIAVHVYVDGGAKAATANLERPDLASHFSSSQHGYEATVPATPGSHLVCVYAINVPAGNNPALGCRTVTLTTDSSMPIGQLEKVSSTATSVTVTGWALDPDTTDPIAVHVYVDSGAKAETANIDRPDLAGSFTSTEHGYNVTVPAALGTHQVCVYAINSPAGNNPSLGCREVTLTNAPPVGQLESITTSTSSISVRGWTLDGDTTSPIAVSVLVDGIAVDAPTNAAIERHDLAAYFASTAHGYALTVHASPGTHEICVYAINYPAGSNPALACRTVVVANTPPTGQLEVVSMTATSVTVRGWALDPDTTDPIAVHVYIDNRATAATANLNRPDLGRYFTSTEHGYQVTSPATLGTHRVCVYAINAPAGNNPALGCRIVTITNQDPVGQLDSLTTTATSVTVNGWALDPDSTKPIAVHVYVDGGAKASTANLDRPDLARFFTSSAHGYNVTVPATPGGHTVCVYAINTPAGNNPSIGCRNVTV